jgi:hypothetical protein
MRDDKDFMKKLFPPDGMPQNAPVTKGNGLAK